MKKIFVNIMSTTGITLTMLALIGTLYGAKFLCIENVFQSFAANIVIHLGQFLTNKFESKYFILEALLDVSFSTVVILAFGFVFDWFSYTPVWVLAIMVVVVYLIGCSASIFRMREDVKIINELLQNRNRQIT